MRFNRKLDLMMNITNATNSALSHYTALDPSHISRLRRGERRLIPESEYAEKMAKYFAKKSTEAYQKKALVDVMRCSSEALEKLEDRERHIHHWITTDDLSEAVSVELFLKDLSKASQRLPVETEERMEQTADSLREQMKDDVVMRYGKRGKREATLMFLSWVLSKNRPGKLLLYSDEPIDWMTEDPDFLMEWSILLSQVLAQGNQIKIIHTVSRNLDEMLEALSKWMPLYGTGAIEPYYYPRKRDGIFHRTLFIAPKCAAVCASSLESTADTTLNLVIKDQNAVDALEEEFNGYLELCKPLMYIFSQGNGREYLSVLEKFEQEPAHSIIKSDHLSMMTLPSHIMGGMIERSELDARGKKKLEAYLLKRKDGFEESLKEYTFREILSIPDIKTVREGKWTVAFPGVPELPPLTYRPEEYKEHLLNILHQLETQKNYQVALNDENHGDDFRIYVKEDFGAIVIKTTKPNLVFMVKESNLSAVFWDYLTMMYKELNQNKKKVMRRLQEIVEAIE